jgi:hypothetical protein
MEAVEGVENEWFLRVILINSSELIARGGVKVSDNLLNPPETVPSTV